jgi:hypothetical protein
MTDITLGGVTLPGDLLWSDEFTAWKVGQNIKTSLTGARIVQESAVQAGRPITLESLREGNQFVGITLDVLRALQALEEVPGATYTLVVPAHNSGTRSFTVAFNRESGQAIEATPIRFAAPAIDADYFAVTLRLMTV